MRYYKNEKKLKKTINVHGSYFLKKNNKKNQTNMIDLWAVNWIINDFRTIFTLD